MPHIVLLGDSIFDNAAYVDGGSAVIDQLERSLAAEWKTSLLAVDGATTADIPTQVRAIPVDTTHLVVSTGGNDALLRADILEMPVRSTAEALRALSKIVAEFEASYRKALTACLRKNIPLIVCTIYNGRFPDADYQDRVNIALATFNDVIVRVSREKHCPVIELRDVCTTPKDYANPIEPSAIGGAKIAEAIKEAVFSMECPRRFKNVP